MSVATESNQNMAPSESEVVQEVKSENEKVEENEKATSGEKSSQPKKPTVHFPDYKKDVVYVYQFNRCPTLPSLSPFCLKVETFLRMSGLTYENVDHKMKYKSKKNQLPFVELNGMEIADSEIIISELSKHFNKNLDEGLNNDQLNVSHAFRSMLDNSTSWMVRYWRYKNPSDFIRLSQLDIKKTINSKLPKVVLNYLFKFGLKSNVKQTVVHGIGRHSFEEIVEFGKNDIKALSAQLGNKDYFFGSTPHLLDCAAFAHLCQLIYIPFAGFDKWFDQEAQNLIKFVQRMKERYYADWDDMCNTLQMNTHIVKTEAELEEERKKEEALAEEKRKKEELRKEKEEKKRKEKEEKEEKKRKEKEEKERKRKEAREKAQKEKAEKAAAEKKAKEEASKQANSGEAATDTATTDKVETKEGEAKEQSSETQEEKKDN